MTDAINNLSPVFTSLINQLMTIERQPLVRATEQRDTVSVQKGIYSDLKSQIEDLQDAIDPLFSTNADNAIKLGREASISNISVTGANVVTADASSDALAGTYNISDITLAKEQVVRSKAVTYADQALQMTGTILVGGAAARQVSGTPTTNDTVTGFAVSALAKDHQELGSDTYSVETRKNESGDWQFRLVNSEGQAVSIRLADDSGDSKDWQAIPTNGGNYDTGRGLTFTFGTQPENYQTLDRTNGAAQAGYTAQGVSLAFTQNSTLNDIAASINDAIYAEGNGVTASVVDKQLVLSAKNTGVLHQIIASDTSGSILHNLEVLNSSNQYMHPIQAAADAYFTLNTLQVHRSQNTNLTDVISGVTLNLAADAEGKTATINVGSNTKDACAAIDTFITKFNGLRSYLDAKTAITETSDGVYSRGALANESIFSDLRYNLLVGVQNDASNTGIFKNLSEIGITLDDNLNFTVSDSTKLNNAMINHLSDVSSLMDSVMKGINGELGRFSGTDGYLYQNINILDREVTDMNSSIKDLSARLSDKEVALTDEYAAMQAEILTMSYTSQMMSAMYGTTSISI